MIYGYICKSEKPGFEFFVKEAKDDNGEPIIVETDLGNGLKVFPVWREERNGQVMPTIIGYARYDFDNERREFVDRVDFDPTVHVPDEWLPVTEQLALEWDAATEHNRARGFHEKAVESFSVWKYLPTDTPSDVKNELKSIYQAKAEVAYNASRRLGFGDHTVPDDKIDDYHHDMIRKHRELARLYSI
ncbi:hypothetical protein Ab1vBOLIVR4_gp107 [Agrobacterium phage OLIVR4]|nr:hypothetical protein Ab1vBOLIVR4_gp107 [Agrobacterium phage OLIVR4]